MSAIERWLEAKRVREAADEWLSMREEIAKYDGGNFVPRVDLHVELFMCGQNSCGGQNYHKPPKELAEAFASDVRKFWLTHAKAAIEVLKVAEANAKAAAQVEAMHLFSAEDDAPNVENS